jgi:hypothetical protein
MGVQGRTAISWAHTTWSSKFVSAGKELLKQGWQFHWMGSDVMVSNSVRED